MLTSASIVSRSSVAAVVSATPSSSRRTFFALARASAPASSATITKRWDRKSLSRVTEHMVGVAGAKGIPSRSYHSELPPLMFPDGLTSLSPSIAGGCFLVSHPLANPGPRTVIYVIRCSDVHGVLGYTLPEHSSGRYSDTLPEPMVWANDPMSMLATTMDGLTVMETEHVVDVPTYTRLPLDEVESEIRDGQWMVVKHQDPWGVMSGSDASSLWEALLHSLGGQFSTLATSGQAPEEPPRLL